MCKIYESVLRFHDPWSMYNLINFWSMRCSLLYFSCFVPIFSPPNPKRTNTLSKHIKKFPSKTSHCTHSAKPNSDIKRVTSWTLMPALNLNSSYTPNHKYPCSTNKNKSPHCKRSMISFFSAKSKNPSTKNSNKNTGPSKHKSTLMRIFLPAKNQSVRCSTGSKFTGKEFLMSSKIRNLFATPFPPKMSFKGNSETATFWARSQRSLKMISA